MENYLDLYTVCLLSGKGYWCVLFGLICLIPQHTGIGSAWARVVGPQARTRVMSLGFLRFALRWNFLGQRSAQLGILGVVFQLQRVYDQIIG